MRSLVKEKNIASALELKVLNSNLGSDPEANLAVPVERVGYFNSFQRLLGLDMATASPMVMGDWVDLTAVIAEFHDPRDFEEDEWQNRRMRALSFCLTSGFLFIGSVGWRDVRVTELVSQMEDWCSIAAIVLAETILSLDRAYRSNGPWSVSPIILQIWLRDHLRVVSPPTRRDYSTSWYRSRQIVIKFNSEREWTSWLFELGSKELLWLCPWYKIRRFMTMSFSYKMVYLLGLHMVTFYQGTRIMRQMGHAQGVPPDGALFNSTLIIPTVARAVMNGWLRGFHTVLPSHSFDRLEDYNTWWIAMTWPTEKAKRVALLYEIEDEDTVEESNPKGKKKMT